MTRQLEVRGLVARYGRKRVLDGLDLDVPAGSVTALLGRNGAGKTTLMRALVGELKPRAGSVRLLGVDPVRRPVAARRGIGHVPDRTILPRWMTVAEHWRLLRPLYPTWDDAEARRLAEMFELSADARYADLSKGGQALTCLVAALAHRPKLLILDEPFSGLDVVARRRVFEGVLEHLRDAGGSALVASHSLVDVERCADRVALLVDGRISMHGDLEELRRGARRFAVEVERDWTPPAGTIVERSEPGEVVLFAVTDGDDVEGCLRRDPAVRGVEVLERDLEDLVTAALGRERAA